MRSDLYNKLRLISTQFTAAKSLCRHTNGTKQSRNPSVYTAQTVTAPHAKLSEPVPPIATDLFAVKKQTAKNRQTKVQGDAQVTVVSGILPDTTEMSGKTPDILAGASLHAPDRRKAERRRLDTKSKKFDLRMTEKMWSSLKAKADAEGVYPTDLVIDQVARMLSLPIDEGKIVRDKYLKRVFADLRVAFDDCGTNINQMAKATNSGKPCPLTRPEINQALADFARGCRVLESLRP